MAAGTSDRVWACLLPGDRWGDLDQVYAIAWALDPQYRIVDLACEFERLQRASAKPGTGNAIEWPSFVVGIGSKRIEMAKAIRQWSRGRTKLVHIGRLRCSLDDLDYLVTTPAYPTSPSAKVIRLDIAVSDRIRRILRGPAVLETETRLMPLLCERGIRPNWINVFVGNPLRAERGEARGRICELARQLDRLAAQSDRDLVISGAPRTNPEFYDILASEVSCRHYLYRWSANDPCNPFDLMVRRGRNSIVTADSISMVSQLVAAGHRTLIFPWSAAQRPARLFQKLLDFTSKRRPKDMRTFLEALYRRKLAAELNGAADFEMVIPQIGIQDELFRGLRDFLQ